MNSNGNIIFSCLLLHNDKLTLYLETSNGNKDNLGNKNKSSFLNTLQKPLLGDLKDRFKSFSWVKLRTKHQLSYFFCLRVSAYMSTSLSWLLQLLVLALEKPVAISKGHSSPAKRKPCCQELRPFFFQWPTRNQRCQPAVQG